MDSERHEVHARTYFEWLMRDEGFDRKRCKTAPLKCIMPRTAFTLVTSQVRGDLERV